MKRYIYTVLVLCRTLSIRFVRDKVALFFTMLFPLLFLLVFGALNQRAGGAHFDVAIINHSDTAFAKQFVASTKNNKVLKVYNNITSIDQAKERMGRGDLDSILELPKEFGQTNDTGVPTGQVVVYYEESNPQTGQTLAGIIKQSLESTNYKLTGNVDPLTVQQKSTKTAHLTSFDYVFASVLGFTTVSLGIFGMANGFPVEKRTGRLRRLRATPLKASQLVLATALEYLLIGLASTTLMFVVARLVFHFNMRGDYLSFIVFMIFGILLMFGFGLAIGGWAKNENQSAPLANLVALPMMGVFFLRFLMPDWLDKITGYLPVVPLVNGVRAITTEGKTLFQLGSELLIMGVWTIVIYVIAIKFFRWE